MVKIVALLDEVKSWVAELPPYGDRQRFGNLAFRDWGKRLKEVHLLPRDELEHY